MSNRLGRWLEWVCWGIGSAAMLAFLLSRLHAQVGASEGIAEFEQMRQALAATAVAEQSEAQQGVDAVSEPVASAAEDETPALAVPEPDQSLWSAGRKTHYQQALEQGSDSPMALLTIERIDLTVAVFEGVEERILNKGVGRVPTRGQWDGTHNLSLAAHRDSFFRRLGELELGDRIQLATVTGESHQFEISDVLIVEPKDVHVMAPMEVPSITLITCYPFYYVGHAPQRYIVQARRLDGS
ncbi:class D sortase [Ferrimonas marina]|uniref:class D sortase n=1 Tax=Ferrimonas marina TaxID=299255 RepID=UPI0013566290|nr:class D sortase [Ferrimonas marina]